jgi:hypothetical protein
MYSYRAFVPTIALAVFATLGVASPQAAKVAQQQQAAEQLRQAEERRQDTERRHDDGRRKEMERRQDAEHRQDADRRQDGVARSRAPGQLRANELVGLRVINRQNQRGVGKVAGLLKDDRGQIEAVIIEHGGIMGFFTNEVAVPWSQIELAEDGKAIITNMNRKQIRNATRYERN